MPGAGGALPLQHAKQNPKVFGTSLPCTLTWYDPALGGTNSGTGKADPHAKMANGQPYDPNKYTCAADPSFKFGTNLLIRADGQSNFVVCKVTDRGGGIHGTHFDLSRSAAQHLGLVSKGSATGTYKVTNLPSGGGSTSIDPSKILDPLTSPFTDIAKAISFLFSKQFLYIVGGGLLFLVAIVLVFMRTGGPGAAAKVASKLPIE